MGVTAKRPRKSKKAVKARAKAAARSTVRVKLVSTPGGPSGSSSSSSSAGGGGAGSTVILQPQAQSLPIPSTALPGASPLGPDLTNLRATVQRLEKNLGDTQKKAQDRIDAIAAALGGLRGDTGGMRDELLAHITKITQETGVHLGDLRAAAEEAKRRAEEVAGKTEELRNDTGTVFGRVAEELAATNQRVIGLQQETGVIGNAVMDADARRVNDVNTLASEVIRTQQGVGVMAQQAENMANDLYTRVAQAQRGVEGLMGETGALGQAIIRSDNARVRDVQALATGVVKTQDELEHERLMRQIGEQMVTAEIEGLRPTHGAGDGDAGGLAALSGGSTQGHKDGGYGSGTPAVIPAHLMDAASDIYMAGKPKPVGPFGTTTWGMGDGSAAGGGGDDSAMKGVTFGPSSRIGDDDL